MECWDGAEIHFLIPSSWKASLKTFKQKLKKKTNLSTLVIWGKGVPRKGLLLLLSHFSRVRLCVTPQTAAHQAPLPLGFSRQEHWSGLPCPSPMHESEKWKWSHVRLLATPWIAAHQAPPSMGFSTQEYWNGVPSPPPGDPTQGSDLWLLHLRHCRGFSTDEPPGKPEKDI